MTIFSEFIRQVEKQPDKVFIRTDTEAYSYACFYDCVRSFSGYLLQEYNVKPKQRLILCFPNEVEYLIAYFAAWTLGATIVPVDFDSKLQTVHQIIRDSNPSLLIHSTKKNIQGTEQVIQCVSFPTLENYRSYSHEQIYDFSPDTPALIMYTSGTTGMPKGVMLSHDNLLFTAKSIIQWAEMRPLDREITTLRLSHSFGLGHVHCYILLGAELVLIDSVREPKRLFQYINNYGVTGFPATPALIYMLVNYYRQELQAIKGQLVYIVINTAPINKELLRELLGILPQTRIYMYYGLTEASRSTFIPYRKYLSKLTSVGRCPKGIEIRLDPVTSEVQIHGKNVMLGYLNEGTSFLPDGWFATGDLGRLDEEGFLYIEGRLKEQINVDGLKINPVEVETVIRKHVAVEDCIVFGVHDPLTFEKAVAVVKCKQGYELNSTLSGEIKRFCKNELEFYKIPREIRQWTILPYTDSGKPKRQTAQSLWEKEEVV